MGELVKEILTHKDFIAELAANKEKYFIFKYLFALKSEQRLNLYLIQLIVIDSLNSFELLIIQRILSYQWRLTESESIKEKVAPQHFKTRIHEMYTQFFLKVVTVEDLQNIFLNSIIQVSGGWLLCWLVSAM